MIAVENINPQETSSETYSETEERVRIQSMSPEETMEYLTQSLNEINRFDYPDSPTANAPKEADAHNDNNAPNSNDADFAPSPQTLIEAAERDLPTVTESKDKPLTTEPVWGDIYIKASRKLRELCENDSITMPQIEEELKTKLIGAAEQFAKASSDKSKIPDMLIPKIAELKAAAENIETYFKAGEDVAARVMLFMLYQMLSYTDRIEQTPQTKESLNDFFRRFGTAGITLSMLDMRI